MPVAWRQSVMKTPSKHELLYLRHILYNRVQTRHIRQESRPEDIGAEIVTYNHSAPWWQQEMSCFWYVLYFYVLVVQLSSDQLTI